MTGQALILQGNARCLPLPDASIDLAITSPPYWNLRAYGAGVGEIGSEPTPAEFLDSLWAVTRELVRVLKPTGSIFINLGDVYARPGGGADVSPRTLAGAGRGATARQPSPRNPGVREKSLLGLPWRYAIGCMDQLGLILRAELVWSKPNGLPESVTDRVRRSHEQWFHFVVSPRYYSATDEIREPNSLHWERYSGRKGGVKSDPSRNDALSLNVAEANPLGKLPGSVWSIPSEPLRLPDHLGVAHYAAFPSEWPRRLINGWSPPGICVECETGRVPVVERERQPDRPHRPRTHLGATHDPARTGRDEFGIGEQSPVSGLHQVTSATILGYACSCAPFTDHPGSGEPSGDHAVSGQRMVSEAGYPNTVMGYGKAGLSARPRVGPWREWHLQGWTPPPTRPAVVVDVFSGTGTVPMVARALGRIGIGVDLSHDYCRAARWRVRHDGAKAISRTNLERQGQLL